MKSILAFFHWFTGYRFLPKPVLPAPENMIEARMMMMQHPNGAVEMCLIEEGVFQNMMATEVAIKIAWVSHVNAGINQAQYWACVKMNEHGQD